MSNKSVSYTEDVIKYLKKIKITDFTDSLSMDLRRQYLNYLAKREIKADGVFNKSNWIYYIYFVELVNICFSDKRKRIIDWGGGWGQVTKMLQLKGFSNVFNYILYPICSEYDSLSMDLNIPTIYGKSSFQLALETKSVDALISSGVFEHIMEDNSGVTEEEQLKEISRVLTNEGLLFIWNLPRILSLPDLKNMLFGKWYHKYRYTRSKIITLLEQNGFEVILFDSHKIIPDILFNYFIKKYNEWNAFIIDERISHLFPFKIFTRDFIVIARKI